MNSDRASTLTQGGGGSPRASLPQVPSAGYPTPSLLLPCPARIAEFSWYLSQSWVIRDAVVRCTTKPFLYVGTMEFILKF